MDSQSLKSGSCFGRENSFDKFIWGQYFISKFTLVWCWKRKLTQNLKKGMFPAHVFPKYHSTFKHLFLNWRLFGWNRRNQCNLALISVFKTHYFCRLGFNLWYITYLRMPIGSACKSEFFFFYSCFLIQYCVITSFIACAWNVSTKLKLHRKWTTQHMFMLHRGTITGIVMTIL